MSIPKLRVGRVALPSAFFMVWLALVTPLADAQQWKVQYFYDEAHATLAIEDLSFPSAQHGIAIGTLLDHATGRSKFVSLTSSDGGDHWTLETIKERPRSLFFLNESVGWMVTDNGIWTSQAAGTGWMKVGEQKKPDRKLVNPPSGGLILRVSFLDAKHGFAVGLQKTILETHDAGRTWTPVTEAAKPDANPAYTAYTQIAFEGQKVGLITGGSTPPRPGDSSQLPAWLEPERAVKRSQVPNLTMLLQTLDGGATWHSSTAPLFGVISNLHLAGPDGLAVMAFNESFEWPSEVLHIDLSTGVSTQVFREKDRRVTDVALFPGPHAFLAAVEPPGQLNSLPIPGKVKILKSTDLSEWTEMAVDYKAVARSLVLAGPDADHLWAATDTGMILKLIR